MLVAPHARRRQDEPLLRTHVVWYEAKSAGHRGTQRTGPRGSGRRQRRLAEGPNARRSTPSTCARLQRGRRATSTSAMPSKAVTRLVRIGPTCAYCYNSGGPTRTVAQRCARTTGSASSCCSPVAPPGHALSLVCPAAREDVPDKYGLCGAIVVEDHSPVADAQPKVLAAREPPDIERAIVGAETIQRSQDARTDRRIEAP
jgi:hypothetical protein